MTEVDDNGSGDFSASIHVPRSLVAVFGAGLLGLGTLFGTQLPQKIQSSAVQACFDNAQHAQDDSAAAIRMAETALDVAGQHGKELQTASFRIDTLFRRIEDIRVDIRSRTADRYTATDAEKAVRKANERWTRQAERDAAHERRLAAIERDLDDIQSRSSASAH